MRAALVLLASCSITVSRVPPGYEPRAGGPPPDCTSSAPGRALLDISGAIVSAAIANFAYKACYAHEEDCSHPGRAAPFIALSAVFAAATVYGVVVTSRCGNAKGAHARLQSPPRDSALESFQVPRHSDVHWTSIGGPGVPMDVQWTSQWQQVRSIELAARLHER